MNATTATQTASFEIQAFDETTAQWVRIASFTGVGFATAEQLYRGRARTDARYVRLILADAPEHANVCFGSASANPVQDAKDAAREPVGGYWSVDGRI